MSTENPTRFEDESSDPATAEAVVLDDLEVPAPVLDDEPAEGLSDDPSDDDEQPVALDAPDAGPEVTAIVPTEFQPVAMDPEPEPAVVLPEPVVPEPIEPEPAVVLPEPAVVPPEPVVPEPIEPEPAVVLPEPVVPEPVKLEPAVVLPDTTVDETRSIPEAGVFPVGKPAQDVDVLATTTDSGGSPTVRRRSIFADAEPAESEKEPTDVISEPMTSPEETSQDAPFAQQSEPDESFTPAWKARRPQRKTPRTEDDILLEGSTVVGKPAPRTAAHWAGILFSLVLLPFAWFFLHDSAAQVLTATEPHRFVLNIGGLVELAVGALALALALWTARRSSLGSILVGVLTLIAGITSLAVPTIMNVHVSPVLDRLAQQSTLGADLASYVWADAASGRLAWAGLLLIMIGVVSHSARRAGRREQKVVDRVREDGD